MVHSGDWWLQAYNKTGSQGYKLADLALVHPQRWLQLLPSVEGGQEVMFNCPVGFTSSFSSPECTAVSPPPPATPLAVTDALFYQMKGLFITPEGTTDGPSMTTAEAGETLTVRVKIYNYSLATMEFGTEVHAAFYAQPWDATGGQFAGQGGNPQAFAAATFIGKDVIAAIPAFCGGVMPGIDACSLEGAPANFAIAQAQWDTMGLEAETYWKIWVVVWMENIGTLVSEIDSHGLTAIPDANLNSLADVPIETYSNNLGFYNQVIHLKTPASEEGLGAEAELPPLLTVGMVEASDDTVLRHKAVILRATHYADGDHLDGVLALFYNGDPEAGGELFDMEMIPRIPRGGIFVTPVPFQPRSCGVHRIFVRSIPLDGAAAPDTMFVDIFVTVDAVDEIGIFIKKIGLSGLPNRIKRGLLAKLAAARRSFARGNVGAALNQLGAFENAVMAQIGKKIPLELVSEFREAVADIVDCL